MELITLLTKGIKMASAKKPATRSTAKKTTTKAAATKKPVVKRAPAKAKPTTKTTRVAAPVAPRSFRRHRTSSEAFFTFRITHQTLYWLVLAVIVLLLGVWVTSISIKVQDIYDQIDATNASAAATPERHQSVAR